MGSGFASNSDNHGIGTENFFLSQNASSKEFYQVKTILTLKYFTYKKHLIFILSSLVAFIVQRLPQMLAKIIYI